MICVCCFSDEIELHPLGIGRYFRCRKCHLIFSIDSFTKKVSGEVVHHYQYQDPHKEVSSSKITFFNFVLNRLESKSKTNGKKILDIGCGYGYFLDLASKRGWDSNGVEVVKDATKSCAKKIGYKNVFHGDLKNACLPGKSYDVITLWDVLVIVDNPHHELEECNRLLKKGGIIGIRTRNVLFQSIIYRVFNSIRGIASRFDLKEPYVFHRFCFSSKSIHTLLTRAGFVNIEISNSPLTSGDPYGHMGVHFPIKLAKYSLYIISKLIYWITRGRFMIGPSLLIWAEKP